ncbi:MAG TPA: DedA family protein [Burkholderiaceae bacterium]|nr:DedA family protein [Burkholderiaceae bacterium]
MTIPELIQSYGYAAVAVGTFLEGETVLLLAGAAASSGHLSMPLVIAVATVASFAGDQLFFQLGRLYGRSLLERFPSLRQGTVRARALLARHDIPVILSIRFLYGLRIAGPIAIGMSGVSWRRFLVFNLLGAIAWALVIAGVGYWSGHALARLFATLDVDEIWMFAALLLVSLAAWLWARLRKSDRGRQEAPAQRDEAES